jgi:hypothetical protein
VLDSPLDENGNLRGVLLSIHLTSNRPGNFVKFLDRLQEKTDDLSSVEVAVKIDENNEEMNKILARESRQRSFKITYISTPLSGGFYGLWRAYDEILRVCDPHAYFVIGLNDEMYFAEKGWDTRLRKYVNLYPDHIYRLRTSMHRERNYYDYWEASCAGDLTAIMTRRWLDLGGGWCPCNGPDSFQSAVAFYFGWLYRHDTFNRPYRERVVHDMEFGAYGANLDLISPEALRRRMRGGLIAWYELMSYPIQQEAARRAQKLHAHIWAVKNRLANYEIRDDKKQLFMLVFDKTIGAPAWQANYRISRLRIGWTNFVRKFNYPYYGGAGEPVRYQRWQNVKYYLLLRHEWLDRLNIARASARDDARNPDITFGEAVRRRRPETYSRYQFMTYLIFFSWMKIFGRYKSLSGKILIRKNRL